MCMSLYYFIHQSIADGQAPSLYYTKHAHIAYSHNYKHLRIYLSIMHRDVNKGRMVIRYILAYGLHTCMY